MDNAGWLRFLKRVLSQVLAHVNEGHPGLYPSCGCTRCSAVILARMAPRCGSIHTFPGYCWASCRTYVSAEHNLALPVQAQLPQRVFMH